MWRNGSSHVWPDDTGINYSQISNFEEVFEQFRTAEEIVCSLANCCPTYANVEFKELVQRLTFDSFAQLFRINKAFRLSNYHFALRAACDSLKDEDNANDEDYSDVLAFERFREVLQLRDICYEEELSRMVKEELDNPY